MRVSCARACSSKPSMERKSNCPSTRFDQFPGCGREDRVEPELAEQRPELLQVLEVGRGGIAELAAEDQERRAVDDELLGRALGTQVRNVARPRSALVAAAASSERWQQPPAEYAWGQNVPRRPTNDRSARIEQAERRVRELRVRAPLFFVDVDHVDGQLRHPRRDPEHLRQVEAGREVPLRIVVAEQRGAERHPARCCRAGWSASPR